MRLKLTLSYDGSHFYGSQIQNSGVSTVANCFEMAFKRLGIHHSLVQSGRTDRGVHASGQVAHVEIDDNRDLEMLRFHLNKHLNPFIYVKQVEAVKEDFHARFSARKRSYRYIVSEKEFSPFQAPYVHFVKSLDDVRINDAIGLFVGNHNFKYFKKSGSEVHTYERTIYQARFYWYKGYGVFYFQGNSFVRSQIRMMVGFLLKISQGKLTKAQLEEQLSCQKIHSTKPVEPNGLYLSKVYY